MMTLLILAQLTLADCRAIHKNVLEDCLKTQTEQTHNARIECEIRASEALERCVLKGE